MMSASFETHSEYVMDELEFSEGEFPSTRSSEKSNPFRTSSDEEKVEEEEQPEAIETAQGHVEGWRFTLMLSGLYLGVFLVTIEMFIVTTALVTITNSLKDFKHSTWIANAYFLVWSGFLVLWSQFSHTVGRKSSFLLALGFFVIASAACAAAQTALQLAFQGLAGAGVFVMPQVIISEAVPPSRILKYTSLNTLISLVALATGPLIGGAISAKTTWRWIFILDIPPGVLAFVMLSVALPNNFPHQHMPKSERPQFKLSSLRHLDVVGGLLFLGLAILTVCALQEADSSFVWSSPTIVCLLIFGGLSGSGFVCWERYITASKKHIVPIVTWAYMQRKAGGMLISSFFIGVPFIFTLVQLPQRLQVVDGFSPLKVAVSLLSFTITIPIGGILSAVLSRKSPKKPIFGHLIGAFLQLVATICFAVSPLPASPLSHLPAREYGFQVLMGIGSGFAYATNINAMYHVFEDRKDLIASSVGANLQFRYFGCAIGVAATAAAFNTYVRTRLSTFLPSDQLTAILQSSVDISSLDPQNQARVLRIISSAFTLQWKIMCGFVGVQILAALLTY